jgi:hypothetical protein
MLNRKKVCELVGATTYGDVAPVTLVKAPVRLPAACNVAEPVQDT